LGQFELLAKRRDGGSDEFTGKIHDGQVIFDAQKPDDSAASRITLRQVAGGDRMLVLLERRVSGGAGLARIAEIGYTRQGSDFGQGAAQRECIVTGGAGTIAVEYGGKTYYVCCSGCRDLFQENPEAILAESRKRTAKP
jgi:YHS domain-containing protein